MRTLAATEEPGREEPILRRFLAGEASACRQVERWAWEIVHFKWYSIPLDERADLVQDSVAGVWRAVSRPDFALRAGLRTFVQRVTTARCIDRLRRRRPTAELTDQLADPAPGPYERLLARDRHARLEWAVHSLDPRCQELIRQRFHEDLPYAEIAAREQAPEATLRVRLFNCMKAIRKLLGRWS